ncbi:uncharacterized protein BDR25DRAFT_313051 [Lindgomyces ingoldianus]|uniref:Uncharacterized protein n=1 Tax=Lindgomyces ingoldianus TaxID=673940 RepID=A0ACB6R063_9PLEO|nr:uncharacterized protein BDR25DRAFT_313051 [Lindgomyces ingoldianus]KAF2472541.1 hypothetical protein BDR25DRAFT_313051 [Lindgomyces ingoldianus]
MDEAPPYSPMASVTERRLPQEYVLPQEYHARQDEEDLELVRPKSTTEARHDPRTDALGVLEEQNTLMAVATAPSTLVFPPEPPPMYAPLDTLAHSFRLDGPLIFATKTSSTPRYQLMQEFTRSGRPRKLHVRRLMASESRSHSLPSSSQEPTWPQIGYDEEGTMYTITPYEMKGLRSSTLPGIIKLESGWSILGGKRTKIFHVQKNARRDSLNPENSARMQKYGYHADDEWDKKLLFSVRRGSWEDGVSRRVAVEEHGDEGAQFEILEEVSGARRDLMVSCWVMKMWMVKGIRWEGDVKGW